MKDQQYTRARLERMAAEGLKNLLKMEFGIDADTDDKSSLVDTVMLAQGDDQGLQDDQDPSVLHEDGETMAKAGTRRKIRMVIHNQSGPGGAEPVFVAVNGHGVLFPRDTEVLLSPEVAEVIRNAKSDVTRNHDDGRVETVVVNRYAYTVYGEAEA